MSRTKRQPNADAQERLKQENDRLRRELAERERQLSAAQKRIADLERQLALRQQNSTTTSKPPSSDGLAGRPRERGRRSKSRRKPGGLVVQRLLEGVLQIPMSLGSTQHAWEEASAAVAAPYEELQAALPTQPVLNADETGHRTNAAKRWLWTLVAPTFVFYTIATSRGSDVLRRLLGATFGGVLGSDRLPTYTKYASGQRQFCWAHFTRNLLSAQELAKTTAAKRFCREALTLQRRLFRLWHRFRGDPTVRGAPITRPQLIAKALPIEKKFFALAEKHVNAADNDVRNLARALFVHH